MTLYVGLARELLVIDPSQPSRPRRKLEGLRISSVAVDPHQPERVYCGTYDRGLWRSTDRGETWEHVATAVRNPHVQSVAVSPVDQRAGTGVVFAGTEPSELYRSDDGGESWRDLTTLRDLPSSSTWSFPPKPETHHVRWIAPHPTTPGQIFVAIEAGALVQTPDGGETWQDRVPGGPYDTHTMLIHPDRPDRLISAAGDGFFVSPDRGQTWHQPEDGLPWRYCWGLAVDPNDPDTILMSVAPGAGRGHGRREVARATVVGRRGDEAWQILSDGLPDPDGTTLSVLVADPDNTGTFYALNNTGLYRSMNSGTSWERLDVPWKDEYRDHRPPALAISPGH